MPWLDYSQGRTPAELTAGAHIASGVPVGSLRATNPWLDAFKAIAPAVMQYLKQKKQDDIANQLQNMYEPPRAEAVDPAMQGAPATEPFTGGVDGFEAQRMYERMQRRQGRGEQGSNGSTSNGKYPIDLPDGNTVYVTGNEAARNAYRNARTSAAEQKAIHFSESAPRNSAADINRMPPNDTVATGPVIGPTPQDGTSGKMPVRVKSIEEAKSLPSGTEFIDPQGKLRRVP